MLGAHEPTLKPGVLQPYASELCALMQLRLKEENIMSLELDTDAYFDFQSECNLEKCTCG
jgi:hypothetical protein